MNIKQYLNDHEPAAKFWLRRVVVLEIIIIVMLGFGILISTIILKMDLFVGYPGTTHKESMNPTLFEGDRIYIRKTPKIFNYPHRGDIVIFVAPYEPLPDDPLTPLKPLTGQSGKGAILIKRIIGLPGDKVIIKPDENNRSTVYINGKKLNEKYILTDSRNALSHIVCGPYVVPKGSYFMLGDNRDDSIDSRDFGPIKKEKFLGRVVCAVYPNNKIKWL